MSGSVIETAARSWRIAALVVFGLLVGACSSGGDGGDGGIGAAPVPSVEAATVAPIPVATSTPEPTAEPTVVPLSEAELVEAALAAYGVSEQAAVHAAWDLIETRMRADDVVEMDVCVWDGETVFNRVRTARVTVERTEGGDTTGVVTTEFIGYGECTSESMLKSALEFVQFYDGVLAMLVRNPGSFDRAVWAEIAASEVLDDLEERDAQLARDESYWVPSVLSGARYPESLLAPAAVRVYASEQRGQVLEVALCHDMNPDFGLYRDGSLINDFQDRVSGSNSVDWSQLVPAPDSERGWLMRATEGVVWGDCWFDGDWISTVTSWLPDPVPWVTVPSDQE